jgi:hypothetical protein
MVLQRTTRGVPQRATRGVHSNYLEEKQCCFVEDNQGLFIKVNQVSASESTCRRMPYILYLCSYKGNQEFIIFLRGLK